MPEVCGSTGILCHTQGGRESSGHMAAQDAGQLCQGRLPDTQHSARVSLQACPCKDCLCQRCCIASFNLTWKSYLRAPTGNICQQIAQRFWQTRPINSTVTSSIKNKSEILLLSTACVCWIFLWGLEGIKIPPFLCQMCITLLLDKRIS